MAYNAYRQHCAELATATARRDAEVDDAERSYVDGLAVLNRDVAVAEASLSTVDGALSAARQRAGQVDAEAVALWARAVEVVGARRLGALPAPALSTVDGEPRDALRTVDAALRRYRLGPVRVRLPGWLLAALPLLGALGALATVASGQLLGVPIVALVLGPVPGLLTARALTRRYGAWLDVGAVALTVLGALFAGGVATVLLS